MSKFGYMAEGELNSNYILGLLNEYLTHISTANDTNGIIEDDFKINTNASKFSQSVKDKFKRIKFNLKNKSLLENYNKVLVSHYIDAIKDKLQILLQTNVLDAKQFFELKSTLQAIKFDMVIPEIEENRNKVIYKTHKKFLGCINDIKYLKNADIDYVLYNSPVTDLKPFLSEKVSTHKVNYIELQKLVHQFIDLRYYELTNMDFEAFEPIFKAKREDFYGETITENGVGEEVEAFIREKMLEKFNIAQQEDILIEDRQTKISNIDNLLKRLKLIKIERMMQNLIDLKLNQAYVKEVIDNCKDTINTTTITNKATIFLIMDNLYYKLCKRCENLHQKIKLKLQLVNKQKLFHMVELFDNKSNKSNESSIDDSEIETLSKPKKKIKTSKHKQSIASDLYDDDDDTEISISEDDTSDNDHEEEVIIED